MKKLLAMLLALTLVFSLFACSVTVNTNDDEKEETSPTDDATDPTDPSTPADPTDPSTPADPTDPSTPADPSTPTKPTIPDLGVDSMSYADYVDAEIDDEVTVLCFVQATQSWWSNKITVYAADADGAYFIYELACSQEDAAKLTAGTPILVTGYKAEWAGEVEIVDATFEFVNTDFKYVSEAIDLTSKLGTEELINYQNQKAIFKGMTVKEISFKNGGGDDIYVTLTKDGKDYSFCVEVYLTGTDTEVYKAVAALQSGAVIDVEGFLYWYETVNTHITAVTVK